MGRPGRFANLFFSFAGISHQLKDYQVTRPRATSHMRLRARDHCTSSTLIGGKGGAGSSSLLHTMLEGQREYIRGMQEGCKVFLDSYWASNGSCFMVTWTIFQKPPLGGRPTTKPGDPGTPNTHNR